MAAVCVMLMLDLVASDQLLNSLVGHAKILIRTELYHDLDQAYDAWSEAILLVMNR
jgi:hypothetical protein